MTPEELEEIEEQCDRATPGPWVVFTDEVIIRAIGKRGVFNMKNGFLPSPQLFAPVEATREDEIFVASARDYVPALIAYIKELESRLPRWIPKKERLPEKEGIYLVYEPWVYGVNALWFVLGMDGLPNSTTKKEWETVSHWHPLPKGPEE